MAPNARVWASLATLVCLTSGSVAYAQTTQGITAAPWRPELSVDPNAMPYVEGTLVPGHLRWNAGLTLEYAHNPLRAHVDGVNIALVAHDLRATVTAQLGLGAHSALALQLPMVLYQGGDALAGVQAPSTAGLGDARLLFRWSTRAERDVARGAGLSLAQATSLQRERREGFGLALNFAATAPFGDQRGLIGAGVATAHAFAVGDFRLARIVGAVSLGYRARFDDGWPTQGGSCLDLTAPACVLDLAQRDQITWGVAVRQPLEGLLALAFLGISPRLASATILSGYYASTWATLQGAIDARAPFSNARQSPTELGLGLQTVQGEFTLSAGVSLPLTAAPGTAAPRVIAQAQWAPRFVDEDRDGLRDDPAIDHCIGLAEDFDGFEDHDGCPEDNDRDAIPDEEDRCPFTDEDEDGFEDDDGCPDPDNDGDGVNDSDDRCPDTAAGATPDPQRRGCPDEDRDHDGVSNASDACPDEAVGAHPDPERAGCPAPDRDRDGVLDRDDRCPDEPVAADTPSRHPGCPDEDPDGDGLVGAADRCPQSAESFNGPEPLDGCPTASALRPNLVLRRVLVAEGAEGAVPTVSLAAPLGFLANDRLAPAARPAVVELAIALRRLVHRRVLVTHEGVTRAHRLRVEVFGTWTRPALTPARADRRRDALIAALRALGLSETELVSTPSVERPARLQRNVAFAITIAP